MKINQDLCKACGNCIVYCPMSAIKREGKTVKVDEQECVECKVCIRSSCCPNNAFEQPELAWPRILRSLFSDPITVHPDTGVAGRGTEELKTNDVTNRFGWGEVGIAIEMGRPNFGTDFKEIEIVSKRLAPLGVYFEPANPVTTLYKDVSTGEIRDDVLSEKVLTAIIEFKVPVEKTREVLAEIKAVAEELNTVFSLDIINRYEENMPIESLVIAEELGYPVSINGKVCVGLGRANS